MCVYVGCSRNMWKFTRHEHVAALGEGARCQQGVECGAHRQAHHGVASEQSFARAGRAQVAVARASQELSKAVTDCACSLAHGCIEENAGVERSRRQSTHPELRGVDVQAKLLCCRTKYGRLQDAPAAEALVFLLPAHTRPLPFL